MSAAYPRAGAVHPSARRGRTAPPLVSFERGSVPIAVKRGGGVSTAEEFQQCLAWIVGQTPTTSAQVGQHSAFTRTVLDGLSGGGVANGWSALQGPPGIASTHCRMILRLCRISST